MSIESVTPSNHLILCRPLLLLPSIFPSTTVFSNESALHIRWPKYWSFSFSISPSNEYSGLIFFRMDWLDLLERRSPTLKVDSLPAEPQGKSKMKLKVAQSCPTLCDPMDYTVHGVLQARILEWVAFSLLQQTFQTQESNWGLLHCRGILYQLSYQGSPL